MWQKRNYIEKWKKLKADWEREVAEWERRYADNPKLTEMNAYKKCKTVKRSL